MTGLRAKGPSLDFACLDYASLDQARHDQAWFRSHDDARPERPHGDASCLGRDWRRSRRAIRHGSPAAQTKASAPKCKAHRRGRAIAPPSNASLWSAAPTSHPLCSNLNRRASNLAVNSAAAKVYSDDSSIGQFTSWRLNLERRHCLRQTRSVCARERMRRFVRRSSTSESGSDPFFRCRGMDFFAEPGVGRAFARPGGSQ